MFHQVRGIHRLSDSPIALITKNGVLTGAHFASCAPLIARIMKSGTPKTLHSPSTGFPWISLTAGPVYMMMILTILNKLLSSRFCQIHKFDHDLSVATSSEESVQLSASSSASLTVFKRRACGGLSPQPQRFIHFPDLNRRDLTSPVH